MKRLMIAGIALTLVLGVGCVIRTEHRIDAHVTLDIRHIEEQADEVLDYMEGKTEEIPDLKPGDAAPKNTSMLEQAWAWLDPMPVAHAQEEELKTDSARYRQILKSIHERADAVQALKKSACVGETNRGYLALRDCAATQDANRKNEIQQVIAEENEDRKAFYLELVRLNKDNTKVTVSYIERLYAFKRLERAQSGEVYQLPAPAEGGASDFTFEAFQGKALCKNLGDKCQPNAWVTIP